MAIQPVSEMSSQRPTGLDGVDLDQQLKLADLEIKRAEADKIRAEIGRRRVDLALLGPAFVTIGVALIGLYSSIYVTSVNGNKQSELETLKQNTTLIIEAVKTGSQDPAVAQRNLQFFLDAGLLRDADGKISKSVKQGNHPVIAVAATPSVGEFKIFKNSNGGGVTQLPDGPPQSTRFTVYDAFYVTYISTYHWNDTHGQPGGQIILKRDNGSEVGRWDVTTSSGQGNAPDVNWFCRPNVKIPAGTYEV